MRFGEDPPWFQAVILVMLKLYSVLFQTVENDCFPNSEKLCYF